LEAAQTALEAAERQAVAKADASASLTTRLVDAEAMLVSLEGQLKELKIQGGYSRM
jgi:hypothetical protein